jgi:diguanylate cyclase (GGDEF)-like protein
MAGKNLSSFCQKLIGASVVAKKIQSSVKELNRPHIGSNINKYLTVSVGISTLISDSKSMPENLILEADKALYQAKQKGRNRVETYSNEVQKTTA